ncbi:MAG: hypothetical protein ACJATP_003871 [Candidatus Azotimanducaceae bacterium]|jgi:hypothetical protein
MVLTPCAITATLAIECGELLPSFCVSAAFVASVRIASFIGDHDIVSY